LDTIRVTGVQTCALPIYLLQKNTDLTEQIHTLSEKMNTLTEEVHAAICRGPSPG
jgi:hypothetical protein